MHADGQCLRDSRKDVAITLSDHDDLNDVGALECSAKRALAPRQEPLVEDGYEFRLDTTLIPPGTQYGARQGNL